MTTTTHRNFDTGRPQLPPSCTFTLGGRDWTCRPRERIPFGMVERIYSDYASADPAGMVLMIRPFIQSVLEPGQADEFNAMLDDPNSALDMENLTALLTWVTEQVLNRPTTPAVEPSPGSSKTGKSSKVGSSSRATRRSA